MGQVVSYFDNSYSKIHISIINNNNNGDKRFFNRININNINNNVVNTIIIMIICQIII